MSKGGSSSSSLNKFVGFSTAAGTGGLSLAYGGGDMEKSGKKINKAAGNSVQFLGKVDPVTGYANEKYGDQYLDYESTASRKEAQTALDAQAAKEAQAQQEATDLENQRKRARNSIFQTEGTGGVVTNSVSQRQSYFGN